MKSIKRRSFLKAAPAGLLLLAGCNGKSESTASEAAAVPLEIESEYRLDYAQQFSAVRYTNGCTLLTIADSDDKFFIVPDGVSVQDVPQDATVLQQPVDNIYLVSSSVMDIFCSLDALDSIKFSGTQADGWYLSEAKQAMEDGRISYAGKYSAPDYEQILAADCGLAIENTMIYHTPEVKEELERFGIPVLVERSSYEDGPLARMEWIKCYGLILGLEQQAEQIFNEKVEQIQPVIEQEPTGKTAAFFSITSNNLATVRKGKDYVAQMIEMAGGTYVFASLTDSGNNLATVNLPLETFYAQAHDADVLIYNGTIEGEIETTAQLVAKCSMLADFKAVQSGDVWCTNKNLFQHSMEMADFITDLNAVFTGDDTYEMRFIAKLS